MSVHERVVCKLRIAVSKCCVFDTSYFWRVLEPKDTWKILNVKRKEQIFQLLEYPILPSLSQKPLAPRLLVFEYFTYEIAIIKLFSFQVCIYPAERKGCRMKDLAYQKVICSDTAVLPSRDPEAGSPYRVSSPRGSTSSLTPLESVSRPYSPLSVSGALAAR